MIARPSRFGPRLVFSAALALLAALPASASLTQRWSFNNASSSATSGTTFTDSVGGVVATLRGNGATLNGSALVLPGTTTGNQTAATISAYLDLPNGLLSSRTHLTVEIWATPVSVKTWQRLFDFGNMAGAGDGLGATGEWTGGLATASGTTTASDEFALTLCANNSLNTHRLYGRLNYTAPSTGNYYIESTLATTAGQRYHYVVTFENAVGTYGAAGARETWYRDGIQIGTVDVPWQLSQLNDVNNWIGRSQFSGDSLSNASFDEVRLYNHVLTAAEISANLTAGPDSLVTPPAPEPAPTPDHRWIFAQQADSTVDSGQTFTDDIGGLVATLRGNGAALTGTALRLPGTTDGNQTAAAISAYLDLPNGLISAQPSITLEAWVTPLSSKAYQRLFDFGRTNTTSAGAATGEIIDGATAPGAFTGYDNFVLSLNVAAALGTHRLEGQLNNAAAIYTDSTAATTAGTAYHYTLVLQDGVGTSGASGSQIRWYRNGVLQNSLDLAFHLSAIADVNNWIGRSQYASDSCSNLALDELRIYRRALTPGQILASYTAGPDPAAGAPEPLPPAPLPSNRWSFNNPAGTAASGTTFLDTSARETATLRGIGATFSGTALVLPGTTTGNQTAAAISAYLDLRNGLISEHPSLTFEAWVTPLSSKNWQRLFDFGNSNLTSGTGAATGEIIDSAAAPGAFVASDNLFLSLNVAGVLGSHRLAAKIDGGTETGLNTDLSSITTAGTEYHYVLTVEDQAGSFGSTGCRVRWFRNGDLQGSTDLAYRLTDLSDVNNWIGRSQWAGDTNSNLALNELRFYPRALAATEVVSSYQAGSAATFAPPVATADSALIQPAQKVLVDVLANDTGAPIPETLQIVVPPALGTATIKSGKILYAHSGSSAAPVTFTYRVGNVSGATADGVVTINFAGQLRITNPALAMPVAPPSTFYQVVNALPGVTFSEPLCISTQPGDTRRLYVCERMAKIQLVPDVTAAAPAKQLFLDLQQVVVGRSPAETIENGANYENGLLGLAFHPQYSTNGYFYAAYTVRIAAGSYYQRISRFKVNATNPNLADPASELILLQQLDEGANHNGGDLHFGPDGYLYYAAGDEENPNDFRQNSQRLDKDFFAGVFRLDVDKKVGNLEPTAHASIPTDAGLARFSVPVDNPFVPIAKGGTWDGVWNGVPITDSTKLRMEYWATGLRHTWRFSFDSLTGQLWGGDVGQNTYEEINLIVKGGNYGWVWREGLSDTTFSTNPTRPAAFTSLDPVWVYPHTAIAGADPLFAGNSVVGGVVYRGNRFPALYGHYIFCDSVSGHIWKRDPATGGVTRITGVPGVYGGLVSMGVDPSNQDVLFADYINSRIIRLTTGTVASTFPATLSATGLFADLTDLSPAPGLLPYEPNLTFWSDYAVKRRWFTIPNSGQMTWQRDANWTYPAGTLLVKHFDLELTRGNPATKRRIETRVLVKGDAGFYGVSYRWNDAQTEATLVPDEGAEFDLSITENGTPRTQHWAIPGRTSCLTCHTPQSGGPLSFNTRQLNRDNVIFGYSGNQLSTLATAGYFANAVAAPTTLPRHLRPEETLYSAEARARSYLAVNCSYCHRADGTVSGAFWDGRPQLTLAQTNLINGPVANNGGNPANHPVVPGDLAHSIVYNRVAVQNGFTRMPPLATSELDPAGIALLAEWIAALGARSDYAAWRLATFGSATSPDGAETADPDGDGQDNRAEFISFTNPLDSTSALRVTLTPAPSGTAIDVSFVLPPDRLWSVETSNDLATWAPWAVPGIDGLPRSAASVITLTATAPTSESPRYFFRLLLSEP